MEVAQGEMRLALPDDLIGNPVRRALRAIGIGALIAILSATALLMIATLAGQLLLLTNLPRF